MNCEFNKSNLSCSCVQRNHTKSPYTGLITQQSTKSKHQTQSQQGTKSHPRKTKKLSLKVKKQTEQYVNPESLQKKGCHVTSEELTSEWFTKPLKKETRGWMQKKKLQIQIKSISRVPTKQIYSEKVKTYNNFILQQKNHPPAKGNLHTEKGIGRHSSCVSTPPCPQDKNRKSLKGGNGKSVKGKEVYSVIDELEMEDETSEVIGSGWEELKIWNGGKEKGLKTPTTKDKNSYLVSSRQKRNKI